MGTADMKRRIAKLEAKAIRKVQDPDQDVIDEILAALCEEPAGLTRSEISKHFSRHCPSVEISAALARLYRDGRLWMALEPTAGRPIERWRLK